jgi:magnesium transporter
MITAYRHEGAGVTALPLSEGDPVPADAFWIDLQDPDEAERQAVAEATGIAVPTPADMEEIEASSRLYAEAGALIMTVPLVAKQSTKHPYSGPLTFILAPDRLITLRLVDPQPIGRFAAMIQRHADWTATPLDTMLGLAEALVDRLADHLEGIMGDLEHGSEQIFREGERMPAGGGGKPRRATPRRRSEELQAWLRRLGRDGRFLASLRASLMGFQRLLAFLGTGKQEPSRDQRLRVKTLQRDVVSLIQQSDFVEQQIGFLLDATVGLISIEQTNVVKILSVVAAAFLPPTLIASIYGMNFAFMPELDWPWGYPLALVLMLISAILPLWYFRRKGWL